MSTYVLTYVSLQLGRLVEYGGPTSRHSAMLQAFSLLVRQHAKLISLKGPDVDLEGDELEKAVRAYPVAD